MQSYLIRVNYIVTRCFVVTSAWILHYCIQYAHSNFLTQSCNIVRVSFAWLYLKVSMLGCWRAPLWPEVELRGNYVYSQYYSWCRDQVLTYGFDRCHSNNSNHYAVTDHYFWAFLWVNHPKNFKTLSIKFYLQNKQNKNKKRIKIKIQYILKSFFYKQFHRNYLGMPIPVLNLYTHILRVLIFFI